MNRKTVCIFTFEPILIGSLKKTGFSEEDKIWKCPSDFVEKDEPNKNKDWKVTNIEKSYNLQYRKHRFF